MKWVYVAWLMHFVDIVCYFYAHFVFIFVLQEIMELQFMKFMHASMISMSLTNSIFLVCRPCMGKTSFKSNGRCNVRSGEAKSTLCETFYEEYNSQM